MILIVSALFILFQPFATLAGDYTKPRIVVTTDITNEPDDQQSLIRLLLYANNYDIEGLIGATGIWKICDPATEVIHECIDGYSQVRDNLIKHDPDYPSAQYLHDITKTGNRGYGMSAVGERGSAGANLIIEAVERDDPRPVWLLAWGGANTIAQAIWTVMETRNPEELAEFLSKIRIYDLAGQDDAGAWMAKTFPELFIIRNVVTYKGMSFRFSSDAWDHTRGGDESVVTKEWVKKNIQTGHGPLGALYPDAWHLWEGDTPTYFYSMPNGLNDPEQQWQGSWGGRFSRDKQKNVNIEIQEYAGAPCTKGCHVNEKLFLDYWVYADADDQWEYEGTRYNNRWCTIFRWRTDFQNEFAARMDWCVMEFDKANHNPIAILNGDTSRDVIYQKADLNSTVKLDAASSSDPDKDKLQYEWWLYKEAGTYQGDVAIKNSDSKKASFTMPSDAAGKTIHVVLTVRDNGTPQLTSYRRLVLTGRD
jgi:hypothetical protein